MLYAPHRSDDMLDAVEQAWAQIAVDPALRTAEWIEIR
jgi:hypothetical protein